MAKVNEKVKDKVNQKISEPRKYKILMYNDEVTTMDFVVHLLMHVFNKNKAVAYELMMTIHQKAVPLWAFIAMMWLKQKCNWQKK